MTDLIARDAEALVALALTRQGWVEADIRAAITDATECALPWPVILTRVIRLMRIADSDPRDLVLPIDRHNAQADYRTHSAGRAALTREDTPDA